MSLTNAGFFGGAVAQQQQAGGIERVQENAARVAIHHHRQPSYGVGRARVWDPVIFGVPFLEEPIVNGGYVMATGAVNESRFGVATTWADPEGGTTVRGWVRNEAGHYTGAYISVWVRCEPIKMNLINNDSGIFSAPLATGVTSVHHLSFTGPGYKALDTDTRTALNTVAPREVRFGF